MLIKEIDLLVEKLKNIAEEHKVLLPKPLIQDFRNSLDVEFNCGESHQLNLDEYNHRTIATRKDLIQPVNELTEHQLDQITTWYNSKCLIAKSKIMISTTGVLLFCPSGDDIEGHNIAFRTLIHQGPTDTYMDLVNRVDSAMRTIKEFKTDWI